ncbi:helix-turn-helix domain-containing protein [Clostridium sp. MD294]|uniref:AraC family transcriptional regulator n=1 Tax=Clostridium sp. MD294 TaxID=97138 RepID=UPI0002CB17CE|nr:helix-turn-helix domain-containing protein [Clostridium sp. MD294]NDO45657.1 AraC family transcriptional regulator [Clostridium sp. MD294]USF30687.1 Melibiose operon regulatory protein [Clostridium sp. MD294]
MNTICIDNINEKDYSEKINYNKKEYPVSIHKTFLSQYPNYSCISHWHEDLEFILILSGHMNYNINGTIINITEQNGILVNSRQFHYGYSYDFTECEFICILFNPLLLCINEYFESTYVNTIIKNTKQPYYMFYSSITWQKQILDILKMIYIQSERSFDILEIQYNIFSLWKILYKNFPKIENNNIKPNRQITSMKKMITFIKNHYNENISLDMIANAGNICKSNCSILFHKYVCQTPMSYLTKYRLNQSINLLFHTDMSITEISYEVGFNSTSYYSEMFKKYYQCTPREYLKIYNTKREIII